MDREQMRDRTKKFALRIIKLVSKLPSGRLGDVLGRQLAESNTIKRSLLEALIKECDELVAILTATGRTAKRSR